MFNNQNNIIIYGGAFNPPTRAHQKIVSEICKMFPDKKVLILPANDFYNKNNMESFDDRVEMLKLMIKNIKGNIEISRYEETNLKYEGTYNTLEVFNHPLFVIGSDSLNDLSEWIRASKLIRDNKFIVFPRKGYDITQIIRSHDLLRKNENHFIILDTFKEVDISSTDYREYKKKDVIIPSINKYIEENNLYNRRKK